MSVHLSACLSCPSDVVFRGLPGQLPCKHNSSQLMPYWFNYTTQAKHQPPIFMHKGRLCQCICLFVCSVCQMQLCSWSLASFLASTNLLKLFYGFQSKSHTEHRLLVEIHEEGKWLSFCRSIHLSAPFVCQVCTKELSWFLICTAVLWILYRLVLNTV